MRAACGASGLCALLVIAPAVLTAGTADAPVVGRVFDTSLGVDAGIHFAVVEFHTPGAGGGATTATTDVDGSFALTLPPNEGTDVFVMVSAQGFYPYHRWWSPAELRAASPLLIGLDPAPLRVDTTIVGVVYDAAVGPTAPIDGAEVHYTYHSYQEAFPEVSDTLRTGVDGRYSFAQPLGAGDWIEFNVVAAGFADARLISGPSELIDGLPLDFGLARIGGMIRLDPPEVHVDCPTVFPVTITNVGAAGETLVILGIDLHFHYGEGVYGTAFAADLSQVQFPILLEGGEQLTFPMTFTGGGVPWTFPSLLELGIISGSRNGGGAQYFGGFHPCAASCPGDCDGSGVVTIDELIRDVGIALGRGGVGGCTSLDTDADALVSIGELVAAVDRALDGCGSL